MSNSPASYGMSMFDTIAKDKLGLDTPYIGQKVLVTPRKPASNNNYIDIA
jgi:hypothetical protein